MGKLCHSFPREVVDQAFEVVSSRHSNDLDSPAAGGRDGLLLHDLPKDLTYRAIHDLVNLFGDIVRIRLTYDRYCPSNRCYVVFATAAEARLALQAVGSFNIPGLHVETLSSRNVTESDLDYVPNILERTAEKTCSEVRQAATPGGSLPIIATAGGISSMPPGTFMQKGKTLKIRKGATN